jgi:hypothetical protein
VDASRSKNPKSFETVRPLNLYRHAARLPSVPGTAVADIRCNFTIRGRGENVDRTGPVGVRQLLETSQAVPRYSVARENVSLRRGKQPAPVAVFQ